ncbi:MAG: hypothetical protein N3E51_04560 [Candidatus Micrarchaeota archaeon]|nr:hypothetical protein [Candidatus Micrarchaeota archaeon]
MKKMALALSLLLLAASAYALFLVGKAQVGKETPVLCEGQDEIFVSSPAGTERIPLDGADQASFVPQVSAPYTVQCGNETVVVLASEAEEKSWQETAGGKDWLLAGALLFLFVFLLALAAAIYWKLLVCRFVFQKRVGMGRATLALRCPERMESVVISDPVAFGFLGRPIRIEMPRLDACKTWEFSYETAACPKRALPARLEARLGNGKKFSALSEIFIEEEGVGERRASRLPKRKLARAKGRGSSGQG